MLENRYDFYPEDTETPKLIAAEQAKVKGVGVDVCDSMTRIYHTKPYYGNRQTVSLSAARNERENFQLVLFSGKETVKDIQVTASEMKNAAGKVLPGSGRVGGDGGATVPGRVRDR